MIPRIIARLAQNLIGQCNMKMQTAINQIQKECDFMGLSFVEVLEDIQKHGKMLYCEKTMAAFVVFMQQGQELFAPVDQ